MPGELVPNKLFICSFDVNCLLYAWLIKLNPTNDVVPSVHLTALTNACQDFADCLRDSLKPSRDREMQVEWVQSFWDWHSYMEPLGVSLGGLAIMDHYEEVNFSFRMVQRQDLKAYQGYDKWVVMTDGQDLKLLCSKKNCDQGMIKDQR